MLQSLHPEQVEVAICRADDLAQGRALTSELDEMWSYVGKKAEPRWLWQPSITTVAPCWRTSSGDARMRSFLNFRSCCSRLGSHDFIRMAGEHTRHIDPTQHHVEKDNTQRIESKHINLRTRIKRLVRRTLCFSKTTTMHDLVIGLFMNRYEFGVAL